MGPRNPFSEPFEVKRLARSVADDFMLSVDDVLSGSTRRPPVKARAVIAQFCKDRGMSSTQIARHLGRNHATIINAWRMWPVYLQHDPVVRLSYEKHCGLRREIAG